MLLDLKLIFIFSPKCSLSPKNSVNPDCIVKENMKI